MSTVFLSLVHSCYLPKLSENTLLFKNFSFRYNLGRNLVIHIPQWWLLSTSSRQLLSQCFWLWWQFWGNSKHSLEQSWKSHLYFSSPIIAVPIPESAFQPIAPVPHYYYDPYDYPYGLYKHARPPFGSSTSSLPPFPSASTSTPRSTAAPPFPTGTGSFPTRTPSFSTSAPTLPTTPAPFATGRA